MKKRLAKKEGQVMELLYQMGEATAAEIQERLADGSSYSAVRGILRVLAEKGLATIRTEGAKYVFAPASPKEAAAKDALQSLVATFFEGRPDRVVASLLNSEDQKLSPEDLDRLAKLIEQARREQG